MRSATVSDVRSIDAARAEYAVGATGRDDGLLAGFALGIGIHADLLLAVVGRSRAGGILIAVGSLVAVIGLGMLLARGPETAVRRSWRPLIGGALLAGWFALTLTWSVEPAYGAEKLLTTVFKAGGFGFLFLGLLGPERMVRIEPVMMVGLALPFFGMIAGGEAIDSPGRWTVLGMNPIWTARLAWIAVLLAIVSTPAPAWLRISSGIGGAAAGFATGSRGPFVAFLSVVVIWWLILRPSSGGRKWRRFRLLVQALLVGGLVLATQFGDFQERFGTASRLRMNEMGDDRNVLARIALQHSALTQFTGHPVKGIGLGSLAHESWQRYPHNLPIEVLTETGIIGLVLGGTLLLLAARRGRQWRTLGALTLLSVMFSLTSGDLGGNWLIWYFALVMSARPCPARVAT